ncbi:MAG: hypothetical protein H7A36_00280 [Chlamydiales bacterium]|nr:hypothetical protein [Chlamydiales bacterium]
MSVVEIKKGDYVAKFDIERGMNFISLKKGEIEAIDQSTFPLFEERCAGLGAMIGPHFHHRKVIPPVDPKLFPHKGDEPFSHGIGRYVPWKIDELTAEMVSAHLLGDMEFKGVLLKKLEGQDFRMQYTAQMTEEGLEIKLSFVAESDGVMGLHTYYALNGGGRVKAKIADKYNDAGEFKPLKCEWDRDFVYELDQETDYGFLSDPGEVLLETKTHKVRVRYSCTNSEVSWQLWHPKGASFACIEPIAAKNPRKPKLSVNQIQIVISIMA